MWRIVKEFGLDYGHRVWSQQLDITLSIDPRPVCRHLHGHRGTVLVYMEASQLENGMVTDFKHLNWFKKFLDEVVDHKFILDKSDPLFDYLIPNTTFPDDFEYQEEEYWIPKLLQIRQKNDIDINNPLLELYQGFVVVDFVPTSENLAEWLHKIVEKRMAVHGIKVSRVQFYETPKSQSNYYSEE